jgi:DNA replication factor GINS
MYSELYAAWQREIENPELQPLPADFYARISEYLRQIKEDNVMLDKKTVRASLLERETRNVNRIVKELLRARYKKLVKTISRNQIPFDLLTAEEAKICEGFLPFAEAYQSLIKNLMEGQTLAAKAEPPHERVMLRFLKDVPAIIGSDMKTYGPFKTEDVASVPTGNAKILVKQGLAEVIDVS